MQATLPPAPPIWRIVAAFVLTPLIAVLPVALLEPMYFGSPIVERVVRTAVLYALIGGYPPTVILGVPAYLLLRERIRASVFNCSATGAFIAAIPWFLLGLMANSNSDDAYSNGHVLYEHGIRTLWGWIDLFLFSGIAAVIGALAGVVFWAIAAAGAASGKRIVTSANNGL